MQRLRVEPHLDPSEIEFLNGFLAHARLRRLWPGQPGPASPWQPTPEGDLVLDQAAADADPDAVVPWLRFLVSEVLAPRTPEAFERALDEGLRCGHRLVGVVVVAESRVVSVVDHEVRERMMDLVEVLARATADPETVAAPRRRARTGRGLGRGAGLGAIRRQWRGLDAPAALAGLGELDKQRLTETPV